MSQIDEFNHKLERMIHEFTLRIIVPHWSEFDSVLEASIRVCDRYQLGQAKMNRRLVAPNL
jgi:hypothetical protein